MPTLVPGVQPFAAFGGDYTLSADQETMTIGASPAEAVRTPWYDMGSGATLAKILWTGTATGTTLGRTSSEKPASVLDDYPIGVALSEGAHTYDPGAGTLPTSQGWTSSGGFTPTLTGGRLRISATGTVYRYSITPTTFPAYRFSGVQFDYEFVSAANTNRQGVLLTTNHTGKPVIWFYIQNDGRIRDEVLGLLPNVTLTGGVRYEFDLRLISTDGAALDRATLWYRVYGTPLWYRAGNLGWTATGASSYLYWGIVNNPAGGATDGLWGPLNLYTIDNLDEYGWEAVASGDTSFARNQRYWQVRGFANGTLTELDLQSDLTPPGNPSGPKIGAAGDDALGANCTTEASGGAAYWAECVDNDTGIVVDSKWELEPCAVFRGLAAGNYRVEFTSASDDGVRGSLASVTEVIPLPPAATGTTGNTAPVVAIDVPVTNPRILIGYQGSAMRIYYSATQPTSFTVYVSTDGGSTYAIDTGQPASGVITVSGLTYNGTTPGTSYTTNHGLTLVAGRRYYLIPTYSDGSIGRPTNIICPNDDADWECSVSGRVSTDLNGLMVSVRLTEAAKSSAKTWRTTINPAKIIAGQWTVVVPRTAKSGVTALDGVGTVKAIFEIPGEQPVQATIPDQASALFEDLTLSAV